MSTGTTTDQKTADLRIQRALAKPGATGMKGFLLWTQAAWPPAIANKILQAAAKYTPGAGATGSVATVASPANGGFGRFGRFAVFGYDSDFTVDLTTIPDSVTSAINTAASDPTVPPVAPTTAATPSQPASASWLSDITGAVSTATQAFLGYTQVQDAQQIFQTNLQRAQQGLAPIPTNPTQYGLPAPTANIGLAASAQSTILTVAMIGGGVLLIGLLMSGGKKSK